MLERGADIQSKDRGGGTALIWGIFFNYLFNSIKIIFYFLFIASYGGHFDVAKLLIERGADIKSKNTDGQTPLIEGIFRTYYSI